MHLFQDKIWRFLETGFFFFFLSHIFFPLSIPQSLPFQAVASVS